MRGHGARGTLVCHFWQGSKGCCRLLVRNRQMFLFLSFIGELYLHCLIKFIALGLSFIAERPLS